MNRFRYCVVGCLRTGQICTSSLSKKSPSVQRFHRKFLHCSHRRRMAGLFTGTEHAKDYAQYRPSYPDDVVQGIVGYCKQSGGDFDLAVDVACGSGQSTVPLAKHFKTVIGTDISAAQIDNAPNLDNVIFRVSPGEEMAGVDAGSVDLVTCAQGAHWLDRDKFYTEARRVLKANGVLCFYGYGIPHLDQPEGSEVIFQYFTKDLKDWWEPGRTHIDDMFRRIQLPFNDYHRVDEKYTIVRQMPLSALIGYAASASAYRALLRAQPKSALLDRIQKRLEEIYGAAGKEKTEDVQVTVTWPVFMLLGRK